MKNKIYNPHDRFFKNVLGQKEAAVDFFMNYLPADILKYLDLKTVAITKDSFIEKELKQLYSDILYQVYFEDIKGYIYLLFEHQSSVDKWISYRLLNYIVKIWGLEIKQKAELELLPPIIPLVLYHGKNKWNIGKKLSDVEAVPIVVKSLVFMTEREKVFLNKI